MWAFDACPAAHLQEPPCWLWGDWAATTRVVALVALVELWQGNEAGFAVGVQLFIELLV
jgi:hypothetical protein